MSYMFEPGFLGTRAPFFMDIVTLIVAALPLLIFINIVAAKKGMYKLHALLQNVLFIVSLIVVGYFEIGVRVGGGFAAFVAGSGVSHTYVSAVLIIHIAIAVITLYFWMLALYHANKMFSNKMIPGKMGMHHRKQAFKAFIGIVFTSFSGIWVYLLLFVY